MITKKCSKCLESKSIESFGKNKRMVDGLQRRCKDCRRKEYLDSSNPPYRRDVPVDAPEKRCAHCKLVKARTAFYVDKNSRSGMSSWCIECSTKEIEVIEPYNGDPEIDTKVCSGCKEEKTLVSFYAISSSWDGRKHYCIVCEKAARRINRIKSYGISVEEYEGMRVSQDFRCANPGCRVHEDEAGGLVIDHCHSTGRVRGLLCNGCNTAEGLLRSDPKRMKGLAEYVMTQRDAPNVIKKDCPGMTWYND